MAVVGGTVLLFVAATLAPVVALRWVRPPTSSFMLQHRLPLGSRKPACERIENRWVNWEKISPYVPIAIVAAEDQRFPEHAGFDFDSIADALGERATRDRPRGASTITQQLAKNLFLWPGRSWFRKAVEAYFTALIELGWPKRRILEVYLNVAQFGPCTFGVAAASERFFGKPPSSLGPGEAALLAAVLPNPVRLRVDRPSTYVENRATWVLEQIARLGGSAYLRGL
jgi:monofunctional biosynthetic peptidoglycan transglycosylase